MIDMFYSCEGLESLDLSSFNITNETIGQNMFVDTNSLSVLKLGEGVKEITKSMGLSNGANGWAAGSQEGERISGENEYAIITNEGSNTYYKRRSYFDDLKPDAWYEAAVNYVKPESVKLSYFFTGTA